MVKIDVQGYEKFVIEGASKSLLKTKLVLVEISVRELYNGEALFDEIYHLLTNLGFEFRGIYDQLKDKRTGEVLQCDCIFINKKI
jgi:hypothetical protein